MIRTEYRAPDDADFKAMLNGSGSLFKNVGFAVLLFGLLTPLIYVVFKSLIAAIVIGGGLFVSSLLSNVKFFRKINDRKRLMRDVRAVEVIYVDSIRIVDIVPLGSNGPALVFFVEPAVALLLVGQWMAEFEPFPVAQFAVSRWTDTKEPIRIESYGALIAPEASSIALRPNYSFGKIEFFRAAAETLQQDLDIAFGGKSQ